jgi:hypothetical protein
VGKFFVFFEHEIVKRRQNVALAYNGKRLAVSGGLEVLNFNNRTNDDRSKKD